MNFKDVQQDSFLSGDVISVTLHPAFTAMLKAAHKPTPDSSLSTPSVAILKSNYPKKHCTVDPIKDLSDIDAAKTYFLSQPQRYQSNHTNIRNYALFVLGINCARRIGDLLSLKISDVLNEDGSFKPRLVIDGEQKTGKEARIVINNDAKFALTRYFDTLGTYSDSDYLFKSRKGDNSPILTRSAWKIMKDMSKAIGLDQKGVNVGTHSMRKTAGYNIYKSTKDLVGVSKALNHSSPKVTERYIGVDQEEIDTLFSNLTYEQTPITQQ